MLKEMGTSGDTWLQRELQKQFQGLLMFGIDPDLIVGFGFASFWVWLWLCCLFSNFLTPGSFLTLTLLPNLVLYHTILVLLLHIICGL